MQARRHSMINRVSRRYLRMPGEHGSEGPSAFYPFTIGRSAFGGPFDKVKEGEKYFWPAVLLFSASIYVYLNDYVFTLLRTVDCGTRPIWFMKYFAFNDLDDPDFDLKLAAFNEEVASNKLNYRWGGTNFLSSYLWQPGDPEPDIRRKEVPAHHEAQRRREEF